MRLYQTGLLALVLAACGDKEDTGSEVAEEVVEDEVPDTVEPPVDNDGDGYAAEDDCDDGNPDVHPGQAEVCDGIDDNCNGVIDEGYADTDGDSTADCIDVEECDGLDNNGDGLIDEDFGDADNDGLADCIDLEECNGIDDDGDGLIDEDFDADGDGYSPCATDGTADCDDTDSAISPDAEEVDGDSIDNDCDGAIDEGSWAEGDLVITEIFNNPVEVLDTNGEWFEIRNNSGEERTLNGLVITDGIEMHQITGEDLITLADGAYMVLGINGVNSTNGGFAIDYTYSDVSLGNEADNLVLQVDGLIIDEVSWDTSGEMPDVSGSSMSLDPIFLDASKNDLGSAWCDAAWPDVGSADVLYTPGEDNSLCPTIDHDGDGFSIADGDCDDEEDSVSPGLSEIPYDGVDNDCNDITPDDDIDGDGVIAADDCDDNDSSVFPGNSEICDTVDNDCDGDIDDEDADVVDARSWYPDGDGDGYGDDSATPVVSCYSVSGLIEDNRDCDDSDSAYNPAAVEDSCDDLNDYNCDGQVAFVDEDLDGFSACDDDCDDDDAAIFPYAWEDFFDGVDNDCDGDTDGDDTDTVTVLSMGDDTYSTIPLPAGFPFCSTNYTAAYVSSNGRITFGSSSTSYSFSSGAFAADTSIAGMWDDLNPGSAGRVAVVDYSDATGVYFLDVSVYGGGDYLTFGMVMLDDGRVVLSYGDIDTYDGLMGWSCGSSTSSSEYDITDEAADVPSNSLGIGQGTEANFHEVFTSLSDASDVSGQTFTFCVNSGTDSDGDDWTDECGDPDDSDSSVTP